MVVLMIFCFSVREKSVASMGVYKLINVDVIGGILYNLNDNLGEDVDLRNENKVL